MCFYWPQLLDSTQPTVGRCSREITHGLHPTDNRLHKGSFSNPIPHRLTAASPTRHEARKIRRLQSNVHYSYRLGQQPPWFPRQSCSWKNLAFHSLFAFSCHFSLQHSFPDFSHSLGPSSWHKPRQLQPAEQPESHLDSVASPQMPWNATNGYYIKAEWLRGKSPAPQKLPEHTAKRQREREGEIVYFRHWELQNVSI